ncbi:ATP-binding protein [Myxococcota bacterium]
MACVEFPSSQSTCLRRSPRVNTRWCASWKAGDWTDSRCEIKDVSCHGIFIQTENSTPLPVGTRVDVCFKPPDSSFDTFLAGTVRWSGVSPKHNCQGMGLELEQPNPVINAFFESLKRATHEDEIDTGPVSEPMPAYSPARGLQLVVLRGPNRGEVHEITGEITLGRGGEAKIRVSDRGVSREHAKITVNEAGTCTIRDLGSRNGTWVNGTRVSESSLNSGDRIGVGDSTLFQLELHDEIEIQHQESQRMETLGRLAAGVAHDFSNVLMVISANADMLRDGEASGVQVNDLLDEIQIAVDLGAGLTQRLLAFARDRKQEHEAHEISDWVTDVVQLVKRTFPPSIGVETTVAPDLQVVGDPVQLSQVLLNLCINAKAAMPEGGRLTIAAHRETIATDHPLALDGSLAPQSHVRLTVTDTGVGMTRQVQTHVFEPYFTTRVEGTGLGLATAWGIAKAHNGHIDVESTAGNGTTFTLWLPSC